MNWKVICFDLDNTLYSHEMAFKNAIEYCYSHEVVPYLKEKGIEEVPFEIWFTAFKKNCDRFWNVYEEGNVDAVTYRRLRYEETMHSFSLPSEDIEADRFHKRYDQIVDTFSEPDEALLPLLTWLKQHNIKTGVISNGAVETQMRKMKKLGLTENIIDGVVISAEVGFSKPDPNIFKIMEQELGEKAAECLFIGDTWEQDVIGACNAGWDVVYLNSRKKSPTTNDKPIKICDSLGEVFDWLLDQS
ncbi:HAD family hydrolase [Halalkalibacter urbisdiaboli]|uniref:HAD family hydrolase n=1 Tax=Halalkalibacter urbisdiaboli TaxID=1960589 RepID=UPI000B4449BD|nr:HAD family hydrolase [Halalkalibacter urbisdiaboli]